MGREAGRLCTLFAMHDQLATNATYWNTWMCHVVFEVRVGCAVTNVKLRDFYEARLAYTFTLLFLKK